MRLLGCFTLACWLFGLVRCVLEPRLMRDAAPARGITVLQAAVPGPSTSTTWHQAIDASGPMDFLRLYGEASKAFNWVKTQPNPYTRAGNVVVAAFYDHKAHKIFLSTILRGKYLQSINKKGGEAIALAPVWAKARKQAPAGDAEDGAFYYREASGPKIRAGFNYGDPVTGKPAGSMIVAWGASGVNANNVRQARGGAWTLCADCRAVAYELGVDFEGANPAEFGKKTPRRDPNERRPSSAPPTVGRPGSLPNRPNSPPPNRPNSAPPKSAPFSRIPRPVGTPPGSSYSGGSSLDRLSPGQLDGAFGAGSAKRPASQSPPGSGQHKPKGPSTPPSKIPIALPHRPTPKRTSSKSPSKRAKRALSRSHSRRRPSPRRERKLLWN
ncbi:unnamed protein product [Clonostachys solani]|uniref:Uncharacterized protein n=1 Tax=Clonostachys solani TaxID=160281 RepID=A0A9P0EDX3_9HYPO|nr:unnamed protein product [Clonostachys solani]